MRFVYLDWNQQRRRRFAHMRYEYLPEAHMTSREGVAARPGEVLGSLLGFSFADSRMVSR